MWGRRIIFDVYHLWIGDFKSSNAVELAFVFELNCDIGIKKCTTWSRVLLVCVGQTQFCCAQSVKIKIAKLFSSHHIIEKICSVYKHTGGRVV